MTGAHHVSARLLLEKVAVLPPLTIMALIVSLLLSVYTLNMFVMAVLAAKTIVGHKQKMVKPHLSGKRLPAVTVQIPIYNEGVLVESVLENVVGLDYPKSLLQIQVLDDSGLPNFSGKAGMWRREVLDKYRWDESVVTEDIELSYRVQMGGWRSLYLQGITCQIELPPSLTALRTQQRRWTAGFAQSLRKLWRPIMTNDKLTMGQKLETLLFLSSPLTHLGVLVAIALWILAAIFEPQTTLGLWLETLSFSGLITFISAAPHLAVLVAVLRSGEKRVRKLLTVPLMIVVLTGNLIANAKGAIEGLTKDNLIFERTVKHGRKKLSTEKLEVRTGYGLVGLMRKNRAEMCAAALGLAATGIVLLQGQPTSAVPLSYLAAVWLITSLRD